MCLACRLDLTRVIAGVALKEGYIGNLTDKGCGVLKLREGTKYKLQLRAEGFYQVAPI